MNDTLYLFRAGMLMAAILSAPILVTVVALGVLVSILQAAFQVQDQTLPMLVKLMATIMIMGATWAWMSGSLMEFTGRVFDRIESVSTKR